MLIVFGTTRALVATEVEKRDGATKRHTHGEKKRKESKSRMSREEMWKRAKSHRARELDSCGDTRMSVCVCTCTYGMVPRCVIECFIHKRRTKPVCLS